MIDQDAHLVTDRRDPLPLTPDDADEMVAVLGDERLYAVIGGQPPTLDELRARCRRLAVGGSADGSRQWHNWIVRRRADGRAIGTVQATIVDQGRAAGTLVQWLEGHGVTIISANIHPEHHASLPGPRRPRGSTPIPGSR